MAIPKKINKIINKHGKIVEFEPDKIVNSLVSTMVDVERVNKWIAESRAKKYYESVYRRAYDRFYSLSWLLDDVFKKYINFVPEERFRRLEHACVTGRLSIVLLEEYREFSGEKTNLSTEALEEFITCQINNEELEDKYRSGLFPSVSDEEKTELVSFLVRKVLEYSSRDLTKAELYPSREYLMDIIETVLKDIGEIELTEGFMMFREGKKKVRDGEILPEQFTNNGIHYDECHRVLEWNIEHECESLFSLNEWIENRNGKDIRELVKLSDKRYKDNVNDAIEKILGHKDEIKVIIVAGPSCSNKTTTTVITETELSKIGLKFKQLNVDDYFKNLEDQPKDEFGDYDFEMPEAIDMDLLNEHFRDLLAGKSIQKPCYNFLSGKRDAMAEFFLADDEILLIDCLHGLYRKLTASVPAHNKFSIYIESMNILRNSEGTYTRWADIRMLKRMIRDVKYRGYGTGQTLAHWPYVRKGELKHILPYIFSTDAVINSGLPYELPVLKKALEGLLPDDEFIDKLHQEGRLDPYVRGIRVRGLLDTVSAFPDLDLIPGESPIREFIGGSTYIIPHND